MKGYFFSYFDINELNQEYEGIKSKIRLQLEELSKVFQVCFIVNRTNWSWMNKITCRFPWTKTNCDWEFKKEYDDADFFYIRKIAIDRPLIKFLETAKKQNPNIIILMEFPNFPYDKEFKGIKNKPFLFKEKIYRRYLKKYIDRIVVFCPVDYAFGIPTIRTINGINFSKIKVAKNIVNDAKIRVIGVANVHYTHGYDRLADYYNSNRVNESIIFTIVGTGPYYQYLRRLVCRLHLENHVLFKGVKLGEELDQEYENQDIAIESLGSCRQNITVSSSLKSREYLAKGLPMITDIKIDIIPDNYKYILKVPKNETPINIKSIIRFYHYIYDNNDVNHIKREIRELGKQTCDIKRTMEPIINYIKQKESNSNE